MQPEHEPTSRIPDFSATADAYNATMRAQHRRTWIVAGSAVAGLVLVAAAIVAIVSSAGGADEGSASPRAEISAEPSESGDGAFGPADGASPDASATVPGPVNTPPNSQPGRPSGPGDEFSGSAVDMAKWSVYESKDPDGSIWSAQAVTVGAGVLKITGTGKNPTGSGNTAGGLCWCKAGGDQVYGTWQVRAKFDAGAGYGPILMLWPQSGNPSTDGFVSFARAPKPDRTVLGSMLSWPGGKATKTLNGDFTAWHTYTVDWRPNAVKISVDGRLLFDSSTTAGAVIPKKPMHLVLQVLVGPVDDVPAANASTPERVVMHVDWVRYSR